MPELLIQILLLATFAAMIFFLVRGANATMTLTVMAIVWALLGGRSVNDVLQLTFADVITKNAPTLIIILFGAWYSQMIVQTGIASKLIKRVVELGGDRPRVVVSFIMLVVGFLFITLFGVGPAIAIGVIVIPILLTMGVDNRVAVAAFLLPIGISSGINVSQFAALKGLMPDAAIWGSPYFPFAYVAFGAVMVVAIVGVNLLMRRSGRVHSWAVRAQLSEEEETSGSVVRWYSYLALIVPVILISVLHVNVWMSFVIAIVYIGVTTMSRGQWGHFNLVIRTSGDGFKDVGPVILFILSTYFFANSAQFNAPHIVNLVGGVLPTSALGIAILFAVVAPLVMYRGPASFAGAGVALYTALLAAGTVSPAYVWTVAYSMENVHYQLDPTVSVVGWGTGYAKVAPMQYVKTVLLITWVAAVVYMALAFFMVA